MKSAKTLNEFYSKIEDAWKKEIIFQLREIAQETGLEESIKWGGPTFSLDNKNIVGLAAFKNHCALWFFQGVFLKDEGKLLVNAQKGKTKALRQWRFLENDSIDKMKIKSYILEAIQNQKDGKEIKPERNNKKELIIPELLENKLNSDEQLKLKFEELSKGKKREYAEYIAEAKRENTKINRIGKIIPMILKGVGLNDKYKQ